VVEENGSLKEDYSHHALVRLVVLSDIHRHKLNTLLEKFPELDLWQEAKGSHAVVRVPPQHLAEVTGAGMYHKILHTNVQELIEKESSPVGTSFYHKYQHYEALRKKWLSIAKRHPKVVKLSTLGKTSEGREITAIHLAAPGTPKDAPEVFIQAGQHAREWIAGASATFVAEAIASGHTHGDTAVKKALQHARITIVPLLNPDGYHHSYTRNRMWRKNRNYKAGHSGLCVGVDPNRNWPIHWAKTVADGHIKKDTNGRCTSTWEGPAALSEAEPSAIVRYIKSRGGRVKGFLDVHSYSQELLPPGCNGYPLRKHEHKAVMKSAVDLTHAMSHKGKEYKTGQCAKIMYPCSGVAHDWAYGNGILNSFCVEVRPGDGDDAVGFLLPPAQILPTSQELLAGTLALTSKAFQRTSSISLRSKTWQRIKPLR